MLDEPVDAATAETVVMLVISQKPSHIVVRYDPRFTKACSISISIGSFNLLNFTIFKFGNAFR